MFLRTAKRMLFAAMTDTPVVLLHGPRQTGKTTLARSFAKETSRLEVTLDDAEVLGAARRDPAGFIASFERSVVIDEAQRVPELFLAIKASVDRDRRPGRFLLTSSANVFTLPRAADSLAGRMEIVPILPLSQGEIEGHEESFIDALFSDKPPRPARSAAPSPDLAERIACGGFPEVVSRPHPERRAAWFSSYISSVLQRDVRDLANIDGLAEMPRLLALLASRTAGLFNLADISRGLAIPGTTLKRYIALLEATFLVHMLPPWSTNVGHRLTKSPKVFLCDTGLTCHLRGTDVRRMESDPTLAGPLVESFVVQELRKQASWNPSRPALYHFRTHAGREVDIVLELPDGRIAGVEVKSGRSVGPDDFRGLITLKEIARHKFHAGLVLYDGEHVLPFGEKCWAVPISALWRA